MGCRRAAELRQHAAELVGFTGELIMHLARFQVGEAAAAGLTIAQKAGDQPSHGVPADGGFEGFDLAGIDKRHFSLRYVRLHVAPHWPGSETYAVYSIQYHKI